MAAGVNFTYSAAPLRRVRKVQFGILSPDQVRRMSVTQRVSLAAPQNGIVEAGIHRPETYSMGEAVYGGINDPRMGNTYEPDDPGHFGHIELAHPVFHIGFWNEIVQVLRCFCFGCSHRMFAIEGDVRYREIQKLVNPKKKLHAMAGLCRSTGSKGKLCDGCGMRQPRYARKGLQLMVEFPEGAEGDGNHNDVLNLVSATGDRKTNLSAVAVQNVFKKISDEDCVRIGLDPKFARPDWMLVKVLPVPPPHVRPSVSMDSVRRCEDDLTHKITDIVKANLTLKNAITQGQANHIVEQFEQLLQYHVATFIDNQLPDMPQAQQRSGKPLKTLRQRLVGKEGRIRGNLVGKRVDFSARTVITPDPNLSINQVGVPRSIARTLTVPERVTRFNMARLHQLVERGPKEHPGARYIVRGDGQRIDLRWAKQKNDLSLRVGWTAERHLADGDVVLFNRQPSLHKMSIMGHYAKVMDWSTFRLNLSCTSPYNADFDGDEMNLHVPQSLNARAEAETMMMCPHVIVSPQGNKPVMGIVQDTLLGCAAMTKRSEFIERDLLFNTIMWLEDQWDGRIPVPALLIPTKWKPDPNNPGRKVQVDPGHYTAYWTGKQMFSMIIPPGVHLQKKANEHKYVPNNDDDEDPHKYWSDLSPGDRKVLIVDGELLAGIADKKLLGTGGGSLIHILVNEKKHEITRQFFGAVQKVVNYWLLQRTFSIGVGDTVADLATCEEVNHVLEVQKEKVHELVQKAQRTIPGKKGEDDLTIQPGKSLQETFEQYVNVALNAARDKAGKRANAGLPPDNGFKTTVNSGSKGSNINISQILGCVGQQNVEGKRIGCGFRDRTLPHFSKDDLGPESRGFVENSYLKGLTPTEFYFHAMGGREGLIDTACKTAETGYIQRRLVKSMENLMVRYDNTVRNAQGQIIQFLYGEDGMDGAFVESQTFPSLKLSRKAFEAMYVFDIESHDLGHDTRYGSNRPYMELSVIDELRSNPHHQRVLAMEVERLEKDRDILRTVFKCREPGRESDPTAVVPVNLARYIWNAQNVFHIDKNAPSNLNPAFVVERVKKLAHELGPAVVFGEDDLSQEAQRNATMLFKILLRSTLASKKVLLEYRLSQEAFVSLLGEVQKRFMLSRVNAGEMAGVLAAQSIGEPATQMTLNTFHHAGVSAKNVTLGVPRLKEIINVSKKPKTPSLTIYLTEELRNDEDQAKKIQMELEYCTLVDITDNTAIHYDPLLAEEPYTSLEGDADFVTAYYELPDDQDLDLTTLSPWVLRIELDEARVTEKALKMHEIKSKVNDMFGSDLHCICTDDNARPLVMRIRCVNEEDNAMSALEGAETEDRFLKRVEQNLLEMLQLRGETDITKVYIRSAQYAKWDPKDGWVGESGRKEDAKATEWVLDTDGTNMLGVMTHEGVDFRRVYSNDICEIVQVLGIEAARIALLRELRNVISFDGSYVNYRHLALLCDTMTCRGYLVAITRHGINRVDAGPLLKCSFEETVEQLMEAAAFAQPDHMAGVSENIMLGQLGPLGTGSFDLLLNEEMLEDAIVYEADPNAARPGLGGGTAFASGPTPFVAPTPFASSPGSAMDMTPGLGGGMTPGVGFGGGGGTGADGEAQFSPPAFSPAAFSPAYTASADAGVSFFPSFKRSNSKVSKHPVVNAAVASAKLWMVISPGAKIHEQPAPT